MRFRGIAALVVGACVTLGGCGLARMQERQEQMKAAQAAAKSGMDGCRAQYPDENKDFVVRQKCLYQAAQVVRPFMTYPDLFDEGWAKSGVLAEQIQAHKITLAEAKLQLADNQSQIAAEEQRRNLANRSVAAQETVATAAMLSTGPTVCNRVGSTTICN
jgi:hypothetical protein